MSRVQGLASGGADGPAAAHAAARARRVEALFAAALDELRAHGYEGLTVRNAARRAGISPATAYTYVGSKEHLVGEMFWQRVRRLTARPAVEGAPLDRLQRALDDIAEVVAGEPALTAASTVAVLSADPAMADVRERIGSRFTEHVAGAVGVGADAAALRVLELAISGALLQAGMGFLAFEDLAPRLREAAALLLHGS